MVNLSNTKVTLLWTVVHHEAITVKVCLYPGISWGTFAEFRITSICLYHVTAQDLLDIRWTDCTFTPHCYSEVIFEIQIFWKSEIKTFLRYFYPTKCISEIFKLSMPIIITETESDLNISHKYIASPACSMTSPT